MASVKNDFLRIDVSKLALDGSVIKEHLLGYHERTLRMFSFANEEQTGLFYVVS